MCVLVLDCLWEKTEAWNQSMDRIEMLLFFMCRCLRAFEKFYLLRSVIFLNFPPYRSEVKDEQSS